MDRKKATVMVAFFILIKKKEISNKKEEAELACLIKLIEMVKNK